VPGQIKTKTGQVVSDKMDKTIVVAVETLVQHPLYKKRVRRTRKFHAHDESNEARIGDLVRIGETRPISKTKTWLLLEIVHRADQTTA
jgi:small subunit ribosomal protein S17